MGMQIEIGREGGRKLVVARLPRRVKWGLFMQSADGVKWEKLADFMSRDAVVEFVGWFGVEAGFEMGEMDLSEDSGVVLGEGGVSQSADGGAGDWEDSAG